MKVAAKQKIEIHIASIDTSIRRMSGSDSSSPIPTRRQNDRSSRSRESRESRERNQMKYRQQEADSDDDGYDYKRSIDIKSIPLDPTPVTQGNQTVNQPRTPAQQYQQKQPTGTTGITGSKNHPDPTGPTGPTGPTQDAPKRSSRTSRTPANDSSGSESDSRSHSRSRSNSRSRSDSDSDSESSSSSSSSDSGDSGGAKDGKDKKHKSHRHRSSSHKKSRGRPGRRSMPTGMNLAHTQVGLVPLPTDPSGKVDINQLVNTSNGTGLLAGGAMPIQLDDGDESDSTSSDGASVSCNICTYTLRNVVKLKCGHKYCYSCIKGHLLMKHKVCPFCQAVINPKLIRTILTEPNKVCRKTEKVDEAAKSYWVYDSRGSNGWWNYDNKSNGFLERDYQNWLANPNRASSNHRYTLMVCGTVMEIDFNLMAQINPTTGVERKINRFSTAELKDLQSRGLLKGIGGIMTQKN